MPEQLPLFDGPLTGGAPPDQGARLRITTDLDTTLFVSAGAGSGKTSALVDRVVALVTSGRCELRALAAITFTEKAGAELRDRIRRELERRIDADPAGPAAERGRDALDQLDGAAIGTLHAFAQRLLTEHPVEAGLPPRVEVLDEVSSDVAFEQRWTVFQEELLADGALERTLTLAFAAGVRPDALRALARAFDENWDLVEERVPTEVPDPPPVLELFAPVRAAVAVLSAEPCHDPDDLLAQRIREIATRVDELAELDDEADLLEAIGPRANPPLPSFKVGNKGKPGAFDDRDDIRRRGRRGAHRCHRAGLHARQRPPTTAGRPAPVPRPPGAGPGPAA
jgi:ATP-dependent helicase/nuclease subunit A